MAFDFELTLIKTINDTNDLGDSIFEEVKTDVLCDVLSVTRSEHYAAMSNQVKPEVVFVVNKYDYAKEIDVEFEGSRYSVIRVFEPKKSKGIGDFETIELICEGGVNNGTS
ncbi:phage head closure protein [Halalkalibacter flavus]|uniref:phage head closure protein n=1 Tax=Halalkalibacter flavus TaxID=3090668 RepID=UPI002FCABCEE